MNAKTAARVLEELQEMMVANVEFAKKQEAKFREHLERAGLDAASRRHFAGKVRHYRAMVAKYQTKAEALAFAMVAVSA